MEEQKDNSIKDTAHPKGQEGFVSVRDALHNLAVVQQKSLKMAAALHLVTELFKDNEPIRLSLREQAVSLVLLASDTSLTDTGDAIDQAHNVLDTTLSFINVLETSRMLSTMNAHILVSELQIMKQHLASIAIPSAKLSELVLHDLFKTTPLENSTTVSEQPSHSQQKNNSDFSENLTDTNFSSHRTAFPTPSAVPKKHSPKGQPSAHKETKLVLKDKRTLGTQRGETIIKAIKKEGSSIKDICSVIKDCSEKTIQRELQSLIEQGRVVRYGEKRWSVYKRT